MSAIFKNRKVPRHLVIEPEHGTIKRKRRLHLPRLLLILIMGIAVTWVLLQTA
jgi:hypothetical protein